jgi:hypothetical protein
MLTKRILSSERRGNIQNGVPVAQDAVLILPCFLRKEGFMNKRIVAISILMLMMLTMAASVFAEDTEYEYKVTVYYNEYYSSGKLKEQKSKEYTIWATSARAAEAEAQRLCQYDFGDVASCGGARATGRSK